VRSIGARPALLLGLGAIVAVVAFQLWITPSNPPGFHRDEASLSLNAYTLSQDLRDEDGARLPLLLRSFGDYKSPVYPYALAGLFRLTGGPEEQVARAFSALLVLLAILLLGVLARRLTGSALVAVATVVLAALTPWLFELGRVALEASTQPLFAVLLLLLLERASRTGRFGAPAGVAVGVLIGLLTYSYTGSRLLGPLLAAALLVFARAGRWRFVLAAWGTVLALLIPLGVHALRHPGALTARYEATTISRDYSGIRLVLQAISNWLHDVNPWHWATAGDPAPYIHNGGYGAFFAGVMALSLAGAILVLLRRRDDLWWRYVMVATLLVPIPAAVTVDRYNALRLAVLPVFLLVLAVPALDALLRAARTAWAARAAVALLVLAVGFQFAQFLDSYRTRGPARVVLFEDGLEPLLEPAFAGGEVIHVDYDDRHAQAQVRWRAAAAGLPDDRVAILPDGGVPPTGGLVFGRFQECDYVCEEFARWEEYWLARAVGPRP
jgi:MFS family permease